MPGFFLIGVILYKIVINPTTGKWVLQLQVFGFFWQQIGKETFDCYAAAREAADELGLDKVYRNYADSYTHQVMRGAI